MRPSATCFRRAALAGWASLVLAGSCLLGAHPAGATAPAVTISPAGPYRDGESVTVSVARSALFTPETKVNIIECADPGGTVANLPVNDSTCNGQTIQGGTLYVGAGGAVTEHGYILYKLPSAALDDLPGWLPDCDATHECVLFVGVDQNDFTQPHVFSAPFSIEPADAGSTTSTSTSTTSQPSAGVSLQAPSAGGGASGDPGSPGGSLAFTGVSGTLAWPAGAGLALLAVGSAGRRRLRGVLR